ncbi:MAG: glycosyltransferase family 2 protein [Eubacteriales bacterium]|nr:glycosyltransferase family 2 protein [Eubacteriales bacterium]
MSLYSIVVPVYNSEHTLEELYSRIKAVFTDTLHEEFEMILVDDSSRDGSFRVMEKLHQMDPRVKIIQLAKNFGQHPALLCGFSHVSGDFVITLDDDLQHPPEEIPKMVNAMKEREDVDVIIAKYEGRKHSLIRRIGTRVSVYATSKMLHKDPNLEITSFRLMRRFIVDAILNTNTHLPQIGNLLVQTSNRIINVPVAHDARKFGKSNYTFRHLFHDLIYDITTHSALPLIIVRNIGIISFIVSVLLAIFYLVRYFTCGITVAGFTTLVLLTLGYNGLILLGIGVLGQYLMHVLDESKKMPNYVIRKKEL